MRAMAPHLWRFWYQWLILSPGIGYRLHRSGKFVPKVLVGASVRNEVWDDADPPCLLRHLHRARPRPGRRCRCTGSSTCARHQRLRGRYAASPPHVPTKLLFGTGDAALNHDLLAGYQRHADDMKVELVEGCGHFIADELPQLVAERAQEFFTACLRVVGEGRRTLPLLSADPHPRPSLRPNRASSRSRSRSICRIVSFRSRPAPRRLSSSSRSIPISSRRSSP